MIPASSSARVDRHAEHLEAYIENFFDKQGQLGRMAQCAQAYCYKNSRIYPIKPMNFGVKFGQKF